eukprot:jgi/Tetstr1/439394/TSEL_027829.t1
MGNAATKGGGGSRHPRPVEPDAREFDSDGLPMPQQSSSPRLGASYSLPAVGDSTGQLRELRDAVGKSVRNLESRLQESTEHDAAVSQELSELKGALQAAEDGVARVREAAAREIEREVARSQDLLRKSASEATVLRLRLERQAVAMQGLQGQAAALRRANEELRDMLGELVGVHSAQLTELAGTHLPAMAAAAAQEASAHEEQEVQQGEAEEARRELRLALEREEAFKDLLLSEHQRRLELTASALEGHGAVPVIARIRRAAPKELPHVGAPAVEAIGADSVLVKPAAAAEKIYRFDRILSQHDGQDAVCREVLGLIQAAVDGASAAVLVHGAGKSGKKHSILGTPGEPGLMMLALGEVFNLTQAREGLFQSHVGVSMLQIGEEEVWDLMGPDGSTPGPAGETVAPVFIGDLGSAVAVLDQGVAALPGARREPPRGCSLLYTIFVTAKNRISGAESSGKLQIAQLAATSPAGAKDAPASVLHLGDCLVASLKGQRPAWDAHVLSLLLKDSLMPPSPKAAVLTTLSPCTEDVPESVAALNFSARCFAATSRGQLGLPTSVSDALQTGTSFARSNSRKSQDGAPLSSFRRTSSRA